MNLRKKPQAKEEDDVPPISIPEMKIELKRFITKKYGEEYIDQIPFSRAKVEDWYSLMEEGEKLPIEELPEKETAPEETVSKEESDDTSEDEVSEDDLAAQIAKLRHRRNKK